jgi:hypothetical protein
MDKSEKSADLVEPSLMSTVTNDSRYEKDTKNKKLAAKPKVGETIVGDDGITGRIR